MPTPKKRTSKSSKPKSPTTSHRTLNLQLNCFSESSSKLRTISLVGPCPDWLESDAAQRLFIASVTASVSTLPGDMHWELLET